MAELTEQQKAELRALEEMSDDEIDLSDIPERDIDWSTARRGFLQPSVKQEVTLTLDKYILDWFKETEPDEKARHKVINEALMEYIRDRNFPDRKRNNLDIGRD